MNRSTWLAAVLVTILAARAGSLTAADAIPSIHSSGTAEIRVAPDEVSLRLAIETRDLKLDEAVKQNDTKTAAVLKFLKEAGIAAKDVQTDYVEIQPVYHDRREQQIVPEYYQVRRNLGIRVRSVEKFDGVLAGVLRSGANHVLGIDFRTTELRKHRDAARQQAIRAAKEKAVALAGELNAKVGKATNIQEQTQSGWYGSASRYGNFNAFAQNTVQVAPGGAGEGDGNLSVGMISVTATVNVTFALE